MEFDEEAVSPQVPQPTVTLVGAAVSASVGDLGANPSGWPNVCVAAMRGVATSV